MDNSRGFQISGLNGHVLSIGIGSGHYCENRSFDYNSGSDAHKPTSTMEVAVMREGGGFVCLEHNVAGWVPVSKLDEIIRAVRNGHWDTVRDLCGEGEIPLAYEEDQEEEKI